MKSKKILILGGTGALGKTLARRYHENNEIIIFSRSEHNHVNMKREFPNAIYQIGDIREKTSIVSTLNKYKPDVVIDAAALKHVPICEDHPFESIKTNVLGHQNVIESFHDAKHQVESVVFVSTDKACNPVNVYGMCKSLSEKNFINFAKNQKDIKVIVCRYGNVLESTGSVIPLFKKLLEEKRDFLPITNDQMTRFLLTLDQSVDLIEWAYSHSQTHGNVVVPKIKALKVIDIAKALGKHYGHSDIRTEIVGIRPGEKIHEEMVSFEESLQTQTFEKYLMITNDKIRSENEGFSFSSDKNLMTSDQAYNFLRECRVI